MAFRQNCGNSVVILSDCVCIDDDVAQVVPLADLAGNVTVGVTSLANPVSVATAGVAFREECGDSVMVPSGSVCDYDDYFYDGHYDDKPDSVVSTIGTGGPCDETGSVTDAPGDAIVVSSECREVDRETLDSIRVRRVNPRSESKVCCGPSRSIIFDEGVLPLICALRG